MNETTHDYPSSSQRPPASAAPMQEPSMRDGNGGTQNVPSSGVNHQSYSQQTGYDKAPQGEPAYRPSDDVSSAGQAQPSYELPEDQQANRQAASQPPAYEQSNYPQSDYSQAAYQSYRDLQGDYQVPSYQQGNYRQEGYQQADYQGSAPQYGAYAQGSYQGYNQDYNVQEAYGDTTLYYPMSSTDQILRLVAFILNIISLIASCWMIIPLAWMIPMCIISWGIYRGTKANTVAFGICTLLFVNLASGILLLCSRKDR